MWKTILSCALLAALAAATGTGLGYLVASALHVR
jgi:hypothetical protein